MIRKSGYRFSLATNAKGVCAEIMLEQKTERDDDSKKSHPAIAVRRQDLRGWALPSSIGSGSEAGK
jgi:hypothetical protein